MQKKLEIAFHKAMLNIYQQAHTDCGYRAERFRQMVTRHGGLGAAQQLLRSAKYSEGFTTLWEAGRLDISMENLVLQEQWCNLFTQEELAVAKKRLLEHGYKNIIGIASNDEAVMPAKAGIQNVP
ncbi:MAG: hypothetical protein EAZ74_03085 [Alphaproteobacteria bacterium]|nr:MAG: hypothetical protein EAY76_05855 [Alphaproteobacteria bacterium]TAF14798.1 MAG: hypothetical protein EAZ74_03085 [Alphaproteobacteria bacterium]TAF40547.1 MAG: hypothetical protein EAZ66_02930 [Alphaproteobacteria bacterium]